MKNTNLLIGKINSGKTNYIFKKVDEMIKNNENLLILDNNCEYYRGFKRKLDNNDYNVLILNLEDPEKSNSYNPLLLPYTYYKNNQKDKAIELIHELGLEIFKTDNKDVDPFWEASATDYFTSLVLILFKEGKEEEINLGSIQAMISLGDTKVNDTTVMKKYFENLNVLDNIYLHGSGTMFAPPETKGSILAVMRQKLNVFCSREQLLNNLCGQEINFENISSKTAIFIVGSNNINCLANIFIDQAVCYFNDSNIEFNYILDNLYNMPVLLGLSKMLDKKLKIFVCIRNLEQFKDKYNKYICDSFENVITEFNTETNNIELDNSVEYPKATNKDIKYFNIKDFVLNNIVSE